MLSEQLGDCVRRNIPLEQSGQYHAQQEHRPGGLEVPPQVFQKTNKNIRVRVTAFWLCKSGEIKEGLIPIKHTEQQTGCNTAEETGSDPNKDLQTAVAAKPTSAVGTIEETDIGVPNMGRVNALAGSWRALKKRLYCR